MYNRQRGLFKMMGVLLILVGIPLGVALMALGVNLGQTKPDSTVLDMAGMFFFFFGGGASIMSLVGGVWLLDR